MALAPGSSIGPYEILGPLGAGGMGEVYKARDTRLNRTVAIKILSGAAGPHDGPNRLLREAQAASALNHPNIVTIHDILSRDGRDVIVMEYVAGATLAARIRKGLPLRDALHFAIQIAGALSAAHAAGIVHRDVKPQNVMVGDSGNVKVLDFGLAKLEPALGPGDETVSMTSQGALVGTFLYMSPEQAEGKNVDARSDIFAFGSLLYEMLAGRPAFQAESRLAILTAVLHRDPPPLASVRPDVPAELDKLVERCLRKDPARRMQSMQDVRLLLEELPDSSAATPPAARPARTWLRTLAFAALALATGALLALLGLPSPEPDLSSYRLTPFATEAGEEDSPAWSPDGRTLAYQFEVEGIRQIYTRSLDAPAGTRVTNSSANCLLPFWSPDGSRIYYVSQGQLWSVSPAGGIPRSLAADVSSAAVSPDGKSIVLTRGEIGNAQLMMPSSAAGGYQRYGQPPFSDKLHMIGVPQFSPDGSKIAVGLSRQTAISELWIVPFPSGAPRQVPVRLPRAQNRVQRPSWMPDSRHLILDVEGHLSSVDTKTGSLRRITATTAVERQPAVSPDGRRIAYAAGSNDYDIIQFAFGDPSPKALLATPRSERMPSWSPQQSQYAYVTDASGQPEIWLRSTREDGARPLVQMDIAQPDAPSMWYELENVHFSPDGRRIAYDLYTDRHVVAISNVAGGRPVIPDSQSPDQHGASWSPDGNWIAYRRLNGARWELVKRPLGGGEPVRLEDAAEGGGDTDWSPSGEWICHRIGQSLHLVSADGSRHVVVQTPVLFAFGFSRDSASLYAIRRNPGRRWELASFAVPGGQVKKVVPLDLPVSANIAGFSANPDGAGFITSSGESRFDIWLLEGFAPSRRWLFR